MLALSAGSTVETHQVQLTGYARHISLAIHFIICQSMDSTCLESYFRFSRGHITNFVPAACSDQSLP